jgi:hypothetical protein
MKKIKVALMTTAIAAAVCCAFVTKPALSCEDMPQFYWDGAKYMPAGEYGYNFDCIDETTLALNCTYYQTDPLNHPDQFAVCHHGAYFWIQLNKK